MYQGIAFCLTFAIVFLADIYYAKVYVPKMEGRYRAIGEIIMFTKDIGSVRVVYEENYDPYTNLTSFFSFTDNINTTVLEYLEEDSVQSFMYDLHEGTCTLQKKEDWDESGFLVGLQPIRKVKGQIVMPVRELLSLKEENLKTLGWGGIGVTYRGLKAKKFAFQITSGSSTLDIDAYWSDALAGSSMSKFKEVPLGYVIKNVDGPEKESINHIVNIYAFFHDEVNEKMLQPIRGIHCPGRKQTQPFPDVQRYSNLAWSFEHTSLEEKAVTNIDGWVDMQQKLLRVDFQPLEKSSGNSIGAGTMIIAFDQGSAFLMAKDGRKDCAVPSLDQLHYYPQLLFDPKRVVNWKPEVFFGTKNNKYVKVGEVTERGIPCTLYHALRTDWPPGAEGEITSLWEWCFADKLLSDEDTKNRMPLLSLDIYIKETVNPNDKNAVFKIGEKMSYHFYNVRQMEPEYMETLAFDISPCFGNSRRSVVTFLVKLEDNEREAIMKAASDVKFLSLWRKAAYMATGLPQNSLRIARLRMAMEPSSGPLQVELIILDRYPDVAIREQQLSLDHAIENMTNAVNNRRFGILYEHEKSNIALDVIEGSLQTYEPDKQPMKLNPPAFYRVQAALENMENNQRSNQGQPGQIMWIAGVSSLLVGLALGTLIVVIIKKTKERPPNISKNSSEQS